MPIHRYQYFSPQDAARMSNLQLVARQVVEGVITGLHRSPHRGFSVEFSEHREYVPGDELRHLDWQAYARSDRYYIKLYEQETNLRAVLVLDTSNSMRFGGANGSGLPKIDYARHLAACIAYMLAHQQDMVGLVAVDSQVRLELPAASSPMHLDRLFKELEVLEAQEGTSLPRGIHELAERLPRRSLAIVISDLWTEPEALSRALQHLRYRKHQALLIHLLDQEEIDLPYKRQVTLHDLETREKLQIDPADIRETYKQLVQDYLTGIRKVCSDCDMEYHALYVQQPYDKALVSLINRRS